MIKVDTLYPINSSNQAFNPAAVLSSISSAATYSVSGYSTMVTQIDCPLDAAFAGTITLQCSQDGNTFYNFPSGAITYTATGVQSAVNVEGVRFVRYKYTTLSGTVEAMLTVVGVMTNA